MVGFNILFPYTGTSVGGSHVSSLILAQALRRIGHRVALGLHQPGGPLQAWLEARDEPFVVLPNLDAPRLRALWRQAVRRHLVAMRLAPVLARGGFDIVHSHDMRNHLIWAAATQGRPCRHVWHQRTPAPGRHMAAWGDRADAFVAVSDFTRDSLPEPLRSRARKIYNPFRPQDQASTEARARLSADLSLDPAWPVIGYAANFSERKRPELFVEIAARVRDTMEMPVAFAMFGATMSPHDEEVRRRVDAYDLGEVFRVVGRRDPFPPVMAGLSVLVAPARNEALGRTLIEAGFAGVPVVATDEGGNREIIEDGQTGWLVPADRPEAFADAVRACLSDPEERARRVAAAACRVASRFSLDSHVRQIDALYHEVMAAR